MNNIDNNWGANLRDIVFIECDIDDAQRYGLEKGDWIFNTRNSPDLVGKCCVWQGPEGFVFNNNILRLRFSDDVLPYFVEIWFRSPSGRQQLSQITSATTSVAAIYQRALFDVPVSLPPLPEQKEIVRRVEELFAFADQVEARVAEARKRVEQLTQSILAKAFRGELTAEWRVAHPDLISGENSAQVLLERIQAERTKLAPKKRLT